MVCPECSRKKRHAPNCTVGLRKRLRFYVMLTPVFLILTIIETVLLGVLLVLIQAATAIPGWLIHTVTVGVFGVGFGIGWWWRGLAERDRVAELIREAQARLPE